MKFTVTSPCAHCPFRKDVPGYLTRGRAEELAEMLVEDDQSWFACHETTTSRGRSTRHKDAAQCAGEMILLDKIGMPNVSMRLAMAVGLLDRSKFRLKEKVFDTFKQFVRHHTEAKEKRK